MDQDADPGDELNHLEVIIECCDLVATPVVDPQHAEWNHPKFWKNYFEQYEAKTWKEYLGRAW